MSFMYNSFTHNCRSVYLLRLYYNENDISKDHIIGYKISQKNMQNKYSDPSVILMNIQYIIKDHM